MLSDDQRTANTALANTAHLILRQRNIYRSQVRRVRQRLDVMALAVEKVDPQDVVELFSQALQDINAIVHESPPIQTQETEELDET